MTYRDDTVMLRERVESLQRSLSDAVRAHAELEIRALNLEAQLAIQTNQHEAESAEASQMRAIERAQSEAQLAAEKAELEVTLATERARRELAEDRLAVADESARALAAAVGRALLTARTRLAAVGADTGRRGEILAEVRPLLARLNAAPWSARHAVLSAAMPPCEPCRRFVASLTEGFMRFVDIDFVAVRPWPKATLKAIYGAWEVKHECGVELAQSQPTDPRDHTRPPDELGIRFSTSPRQ